MIQLTPKGMERDTVGYWQPITLFNVSYMVLAEVFAKVQVLSNMFINVQFILDNFITQPGKALNGKEALVKKHSS